MGAIINGTLKNKESWYRPLFFCTEKKNFQINGFVIYDADKQKIVAELKQGWLNDSCTEIPDIELQRKRDIDLSKKTPYLIPDYLDFGLEGKHTYTVYVPVGKFAEMGEQRSVEMKYPNMGTMVQTYAKAAIFGQNTEICLSSEPKFYQSFQKRRGICNVAKITDFELIKVLEQIKENGYSIDELLEDK